MRRLGSRKLGSRSSRFGVTLTEMVVTLAILAVLAAVVSRNVVNSSISGGDAQRIDDVAATLSKISNAASRNSMFRATTGSATSFSWKMQASGGTNPSRLSYLTTKVGLSQANYCGTAYASTPWTYPFYNRIFPTAGIQIGEGFFADDRLIRYDSLGVSSTVASLDKSGSMAIVMRSVRREDAQALRDRVEGNRANSLGAVRFDATIDPTIVYYHWNVHGC